MARTYLIPTRYSCDVVGCSDCDMVNTPAVEVDGGVLRLQWQEPPEGWTCLKNAWICHDHSKEMENENEKVTSP